MKFLIAGGTGLVGEALIELLLKKNHSVHVLSRSKKEDRPGIKYFIWDVVKGQIELDAFEGVDVLINLSGAGIADEKWTAKRKKIIIDSRVKTNDFLYKTIQKEKIKLKKFISASGVNCYGWEDKNQIRKEEDAYGEDFLSKVVKVWEQSALQFESICDVTILRISMVLSPNGGALDRLSKFVNWRIGSPLGSGNQYLQWVHIEDLTNAFLFFSINQKPGIYNVSADQQTTNKVFMSSLNEVLGKKPWVPSAPKFALKLVMGEMSEMVLEGVKVSNEKVKNAGFQLKYNQIDDAFKDIFKNK